MKKTFKTCNRYFTCILYEEDPNFEEYTKNIKKYYTEVTYIRHDRDITEEGEIKKPHYHVIFKVGDNAHWVNSVAEQIGIPPNYLEGCNKDNMLLYLIHKNAPDKTQYEFDEVQGELKSRLAELIIRGEPEENKARYIFEFLEKTNCKSITELTYFCIQANLYTVLRKNAYIFSQIIKENQMKGKQNNEYKELQKRNTN